MMPPDVRRMRSLGGRAETPASSRCTGARGRDWRWRGRWPRGSRPLRRPTRSAQRCKISATACFSPLRARRFPGPSTAASRGVHGPSRTSTPPPGRCAWCSSSRPWRRHGPEGRRNGPDASSRRPARLAPCTAGWRPWIGCGTRTRLRRGPAGATAWPVCGEKVVRVHRARFTADALNSGRRGSVADTSSGHSPGVGRKGRASTGGVHRCMENDVPPFWSSPCPHAPGVGAPVSS